MRLFAVRLQKNPELFFHIYPTSFQVSMCSSQPVIQLDVELLASPESGCYFAFQRGPDEFSFVYHSEELVKLCSPDGFTRATADGEGRIVPVKLSVAPN